MLDVCFASQGEECLIHSFKSYYSLSKCRQAIQTRNSNACQLIWTDEACSNNQGDRFHRAGSGVFYADGHSMNW